MEVHYNYDDDFAFIQMLNGNVPYLKFNYNINADGDVDNLHNFTVIYDDVIIKTYTKDHLLHFNNRKPTSNLEPVDALITGMYLYCNNL